MAAVGTGKRNRDLLKCVGEDTGEVLQVDEKRRRLFQVGPVDKLKINGFLYGIIILSITGGHFL